MATGSVSDKMSAVAGVEFRPSGSFSAGFALSSTGMASGSASSNCAFFDFFLSFLFSLVEIEPQASASSGNASVAGGVVGSRAFSGEISAVAGVGS